MDHWSRHHRAIGIHQEIYPKDANLDKVAMASAGVAHASGEAPQRWFHNTIIVVAQRSNDIVRRVTVEPFKQVLSKHAEDLDSGLNANGEEVPAVVFAFEQ